MFAKQNIWKLKSLSRHFGLGIVLPRAELVSAEPALAVAQFWPDSGPVLTALARAPPATADDLEFFSPWLQSLDGLNLGLKIHLPLQHRERGLFYQNSRGRETRRKWGGGGVGDGGSREGLKKAGVVGKLGADVFISVLVQIEILVQWLCSM